MGRWVRQTENETASKIHMRVVRFFIYMFACNKCTHMNTHTHTHRDSERAREYREVSIPGLPKFPLALPQFAAQDNWACGDKL